MNRLKWMLLLNIFAVISASSVNASTVNITVRGIRNSNGHLIFGLFKSPQEFPFGDGVFQKVDAKKNVAQYTFTNIKKGTYAIIVLHDENDNKKLDANFFGIPSEGYGASLNHHQLADPPLFSDNKFDLSDTDEKDLIINLKYW